MLAKLEEEMPIDKIMLAIVTVIRCVTTLTRPLSEWVLDFFYTLFLGRTRRLPPIRNKILLMTAQEVAEKIRKRQLTSEEVVSAYVARCREVHPLVNAVTDDRYEAALVEARDVDRLISSGAKTEKQLAQEMPLLGVPFCCKEAIGVKGLIQTSGIYRFREHVAERDSDTAALYRAAGAIPLGVTNVPEGCMWWESANLIFGRTLNPYDNNRSVGGSSGGEAVLLTSCGSPIGIGNDIAGSIRIPASFCGVYGHKPSRELISNVGNWPEDGEEAEPFVSTGPMCRYAQDLPLLCRILAGPNAHKVPFDAKVDFRKVKVYYLEEFPGVLLSATHDIKNAVRTAARHFEQEFGCEAIRLDNCPELGRAFYMWECKILESGIPPFRQCLSGGPEHSVSLTWHFLKSLVRCSEHTWPALYFAAVDRRSKNKYYYECLEMYDDLKRKLEECLSGDAILLIPTHPDPPPHYLMTIPKYPNIAYTCIFSILGYPSTQIPTGLSRGLPIGIQAIGTQYKDHLTLAAAVELDKVFGGWKNPGPVDL